MEIEVLQRLSTNQFLVLLALAHRAHATPGQFIGLHQVYKDAYPAVCEQHGWRPLVYSQFLSIVNGTLQSYDLVSSVLERRRMGGYVRLIEPNFTPADVMRVAQSRFRL
jgi:Cdc6-like AAA superfamily ATPase